MNERITSVANPRIKDLVSILSNQGSNKEEFFLVEGFHLVDMARTSGCLVEVYALKPYKFEKCYTVTENVLNRITSTKTPQGIVGKCRKSAPREPFSSNTIFFLDGVQDPGNVGTIFRTLLALGFREIFLSPTCASPYNPKTILASQGAIFRELHQISGAESVLLFAKKNKYQIVTTEVDENAKSYEILEKYIGKLLVVFGNESTGVSMLMKEKKDFAVYIPIEGIDSLNVGIATGIIANALRKRSTI